MDNLLFLYLKYSYYNRVNIFQLSCIWKSVLLCFSLQICTVVVKTSQGLSNKLLTNELQTHGSCCRLHRLPRGWEFGDQVLPLGPAGAGKGRWGGSFMGRGRQKGHGAVMRHPGGSAAASGFTLEEPRPFPWAKNRWGWVAVPTWSSPAVRLQDSGTGSPGWAPLGTTAPEVWDVSNPTESSWKHF